MRFHFFFLALGISAPVFSQTGFPIPEPVISVEQTTIDIENKSHFALTFYTNSIWDYELQTLSSAGVWKSNLSIRGVDDQVTLPLVNLEVSPSGNSNNLVLPTMPIQIQVVDSGGAFLSWQSFSDDSTITYFDPSVPTSVVPGFPPFAQGTSSRTFLVTSSATSHSGPVTENPPLSSGDQSFLEDFQSMYPTLTNPSQNTDGVILGLQTAGSKQIVRMKATIPDSDRDGIPDDTETANETDPKDPDSDNDGVWDGAEHIFRTDPNDSNDKVEGPTGEPLNNLPGVKLKEVSFFENHELTSDSSIVRYSDPQWVSGSHNYPISYKQNGKMYVSAIFELDEDATEVKLTMGSGNGVSLPETGLTPSNDGKTFTLGTTMCEGELPDTVRVFGTPDLVDEDREFFEMTWVLKVKRGDENTPNVYIFKSEHTLYLTNEKPASWPDSHHEPGVPRTLRQESLFYHACRHVNGKLIGENLQNGLAPLDFMKKIYGGFTDRFVGKVFPASSLENNLIPLRYYGDGDIDGLPDEALTASCVSSKALLRLGNGQCSAWADFLYELGKVHGKGVPIEMIELKPASTNVDWFIVKNVFDFDPMSSGSSGNNLFPYVAPDDFVTHKANEPIGLAGQGLVGSDPAKQFQVHYINRVGETLFDPSYGTLPISPNNGVDSVKIYEDTYIKFYGKEQDSPNNKIFYRENNNAGGSELSIKKFRE